MNDRRALLTAALAFVQLAPQTSALRALHAWLDSWTGLGHVVVGMERQGFKVSLRSIAVDVGWVASFHGDPGTSAAGYAAAATPWAAVQRAAWTAMKSRVTT